MYYGVKMIFYQSNRTGIRDALLFRPTSNDAFSGLTNTGSMQSRLSSFALNMKKELARGGRHLIRMCPPARSAQTIAPITAMTGAWPRYSTGRLHSDLRSSNLANKVFYKLICKWNEPVSGNRHAWPTKSKEKSHLFYYEVCVGCVYLW